MGFWNVAALVMGLSPMTTILGEALTFVKYINAIIFLHMRNKVKAHGAGD
jgi:hypothetical protein